MSTRKDYLIVKHKRTYIKIYVSRHSFIRPTCKNDSGEIVPGVLVGGKRHYSFEDFLPVGFLTNATPHQVESLLRVLNRGTDYKIYEKNFFEIILRFERWNGFGPPTIRGRDVREQNYDAYDIALKFDWSKELDGL